MNEKRSQKSGGEYQILHQNLVRVSLLQKTNKTKQKRMNLYSSEVNEGAKLQFGANLD